MKYLVQVDDTIPVFVGRKDPVTNAIALVQCETTDGVPTQGAPGQQGVPGAPGPPGAAGLGSVIFPVHGAPLDTDPALSTARNGDFALDVDTGNLWEKLNGTFGGDQNAGGGGGGGGDTGGAQTAGTYANPVVLAPNSSANFSLDPTWTERSEWRASGWNSAFTPHYIFTFTVQNAGTFNFVLTDRDNANTDTIMILFDSLALAQAGVQGTQRDWNDDANGALSALTGVVLQPGTYVIEIAFFTPNAYNTVHHLTLTAS